jgi:hypothetical protein
VRSVILKPACDLALLPPPLPLPPPPPLHASHTATLVCRLVDSWDVKKEGEDWRGWPVLYHDQEGRGARTPWLGPLLLKGFFAFLCDVSNVAGPPRGLFFFSAESTTLVARRR